MYTISEIKQLIKSGNVHIFYADWTWRTLAARIIKDNHSECQLCKSKGKYTRATMVHHVKHLKEFPELAYSRTYTDDTGTHIQLLPLCHDCHEKIHERGRYSGKERFTNEEKW